MKSFKEIHQQNCMIQDLEMSIVQKQRRRRDECILSSISFCCNITNNHVHILYIACIIVIRVGVCVCIFDIDFPYPTIIPPTYTIMRKPSNCSVPSRELVS